MQQPESLQSVAMKAVVELGCWEPDMVPCTILPEMLAMEENISGRLTGSRYYDFQNCCFFDVDWIRGNWMFTSRNSPDWSDGTKVEVRAGCRTAMSAEWAHLFGVDGTAAEHYGFNIDRTEIDLKRGTVNFFGTLPPYSEEGEDRFRSEFRFDQYNFTLDIITMVMEEGSNNVCKTMKERTLDKFFEHDSIFCPWC